MATNPNNSELPRAAPRRLGPSRMLGSSGYGIGRAVAELQAISEASVRQFSPIVSITQKKYRKEVVSHRHQSVQKRTFTRWMNSHLRKWRPPMEITDLFEDIKDGTKLIALLQILSGERLVTETSRKSKRVGYLTNIQNALQLLESKKIKLVNINAADVVDGKPSIVLGLLWSIILYFQIRQTLLPILTIEQLTGNLPLSGELSTSTSSLDSMSSGPPQKRRTGTKSKWKGAAKKALLQWVKKKTANNPDGLNVAVKDFGPSWRDGKAFNKMIYTIRPELVDPEKIAQSSNIQNLEHAFVTAEKHLGIPRLLEPEDVDVDRPDEKSIMTYVVQFVKGFSEVGDVKEDTPQVDEDILQYEEVMEYLHEAETKLADVHKRFRYRNQDYADRLEFQKDFDKFDDRAHLLRDKWSNGQASSITAQQIEEMDALLEKIEKSGKKWHRELDSRLPGQLGEVGAWLHVAEEVLSRRYGNEQNQPSADAIKKQMEDHRAVFKNKKIMEQMFQRSRNTRTSQMGRQPSIPKEQLEDFSQRFSRISSESASRTAKFEYLDAQNQAAAVLAAAESMLKPWSVKPGGKESVEDLLRSFQETVLKPKLMEKFKAVGDRLRNAGHSYLDSSIPPEDGEEAERLLQEQTAQIDAVCAHLQSVHDTLDAARKNWVQFDQCVDRLAPWLEDAENVIKTKGIKGKEFFNDLPQFEKLHATLNDCGKFLVGTCNPKVSDEVSKRLAALNGRWKKVHGTCKKYMLEEELAKSRNDFKVGVIGLQGWLETVETSLEQTLPFENQAVEDHLRDMEEVRGEMQQAEDKYKEVSGIAQALVKGTPQEQVNDMLVTMTKIKDRLLKARGGVNKSIADGKELVAPLRGFSEDLETVETWAAEAKALMSEYANSDKDIESLYQKHQQFFANSQPVQEKLGKIGQALEKLKRHALPGMDTTLLQDRVTEASANFQLAAKQGSEWKPKLKSGTESLRDYRKHLGAMQRWLQHAEKLLDKPVDAEAPRKLTKEHREFFGEVDTSSLISLVGASKKCQAAQISESQRSKVMEMTNQVQHDYASALKRSTHRLLKLKFLEAEEEFQALIAACNAQIGDEDAQLEKGTKTNQELLEEHKKIFDDAFVKFDSQLNAMDSLCENLKEALPGDYVWGQKLTNLRERYEDVTAAEEEMYLKLTELPEKWAEFSKKIQEVKDWVKEAEEVMAAAHARVEPDQNSFDVTAAKFQKVSEAKGEHLNALERLSADLSHLAKHSPPEQIEKNREALMRLTANCKSVMNALPVTERRVDSVQNCLRYKDNIQETLCELDREIQRLESLSKDGGVKPLDSMEVALQALDEFQEDMSALDALSTRVTDEISLGEELHSDEQCPAFLYTEVSELKRKWEDLQDAAAKKEKELTETVQLWQEHENILKQIKIFLEQTGPALESKLRLSNMKGIDHELEAKHRLKDQVDHAARGMELALANIEKLEGRTGEDGLKKLKDEHECINEKLLEAKSALDASIAQVQGIKQNWISCDTEMDQISDWTKTMQAKVGEVERSEDTPEDQFSKAQELLGEIQAESRTLSQLEERLGNIEGLESPTTLHAKLANVRNQREQVLSRAQTLVTSLGENLSHQDKFDSTAQQVEESLRLAERELEKEIEPCVSSDDAQDRKDELLKFGHSLEQVKLGLTTLQSEAKLLKDPSKAHAKKQTLQHKYADVMNRIRSRSHNFDDAVSKWQQFEKKLYAVKQFIDRCECVAAADNSALPGDPQKLKLELQTADKLWNEVPTNKNALQDAREFVDEIDKVSPVDTETVLHEINQMDATLTGFPQQIADRQRIVSAALASHLQYNQTVDGFTSWLMRFEKTLRSTTDVYLEEVPLAVDVIKVCICHIRRVS